MRIVLLCAWLWAVSWSATVRAEENRSAVPLQPKAGWALAYEQDMCILSRAYAADTGDHSIGIQSSMPQSDEVTLIALVPQTRSSFRTHAPMTVSLSNESEPLATEAIITPLVDRKQTLFEIVIPRAMADVMRQSETVSLKGYGFDRSFVLRGTAKAIEAIEACELNLAKALGLEPSLFTDVATPAVGRPGTWISYEDYPDRAMTEGRSGIVSVLWHIGADAKIDRCQILRSSGHADLDQATCNAIMRRGRYSAPARGHDGQPVPSIGSRRVVWRVLG